VIAGLVEFAANAATCAMRVFAQSDFGHATGRADERQHCGQSPRANAHEEG
jgi:hypothetical protein